jgi:hypothetical protein
MNFRLNWMALPFTVRRSQENPLDLKTGNRPVKLIRIFQNWTKLTKRHPGWWGAFSTVHFSYHAFTMMPVFNYSAAVSEPVV